MRKIRIIIEIFSLIGVVFGTFLFSYWYFLDGVYVNRILDQDALFFEVAKKEFYPGQMVQVKGAGVCKLRSIKADKYGFFTDTIQVPYAKVEQSLPVGCYGKGTLFNLYPVPTIAKKGIYHIEGYYEYRVNPLKKIQVLYTTNNFYVNEYEGYIE